MFISWSHETTFAIADRGLPRYVNYFHELFYLHLCTLKDLLHEDCKPALSF